MSKLFSNTIRKLKNARKSMRKPIEANVSALAGRLRTQLEKASPVDQGVFKKNWVVRRNNKRTGVFSSFSIWNTTIYGNVLEYGSPSGGLPWPSPGPKTTESGGKIYSKQAVGGIFTQLSLGRWDTELRQNINAGLKVAFK